MRILFYSICFTLLGTVSLSAVNEQDSLLRVLDKVIAERTIYVRIREERINHLKQQAREVRNQPDELYRLQRELFNEYKAYSCDSAISCLNANLKIARLLDDRDKIHETLMLFSYHMASSGMYKESLDMLDSVDRGRLKEEQLPAYYSAREHLYGELAFYTQAKDFSDDYMRLSNIYKDSLLAVIDPMSDLALNLRETMCRDQGDIEGALVLNDKRLKRTVFGTPEYASVTFFRSLSYRTAADRHLREKYLILSSWSDIQSGIKDYASLVLLASMLYEDGDIDRAYTYIRCAWDDVNFYNAQLRSMQIAGILSIIDKTYQASSEMQKQKLRLLLLLISILTVLLIGAVIYIGLQMKRLSTARNHLQEANGQLTHLNTELSEMNRKLQETNFDLTESNQIKEVYIGQFLTLCSTYIDKLDNYRKQVNKKIQSGQVDELYKQARSEAFMESELKEFYTNFDTTFLHLFPDFIHELNGLLEGTNYFVHKKGELLSTELRIFALIRLGIDDSSRIAHLLRYSVNTIYNYRAKVKNKARYSRDDFENQVKKIGSLHK